MPKWRNKHYLRPAPLTEYELRHLFLNKLSIPRTGTFISYIFTNTHSKENTMSVFFSSQRILKTLANTSMLLVCIIVILLLTTSCTTVPTKQTTSADTPAKSLAVKEKSGNGTTEDPLQKLECRDVEVTGSRFKKKVCEYKETWAAIDKENNKKSSEYVKKIDEQSGLVNPEGKANAGGGIYNDAMTPPGGY
jgi:hypothetical protein